MIFTVWSRSLCQHPHSYSPPERKCGGARGEWKSWSQHTELSLHKNHRKDGALTATNRLCMEVWSLSGQSHRWHASRPLLIIYRHNWVWSEVAAGRQHMLTPGVNSVVSSAERIKKQKKKIKVTSWFIHLPVLHHFIPVCVVSCFLFMFLSNSSFSASLAKFCHSIYLRAY